MVTPEAGGPDTSTDPWRKWGRFFAGAWIFFLAFPIIAALNSPLAPWWRYGSVVLLLAFAAIYLTSFTSIPNDHGPAKQWGVFAALALITLLVSPVVGLNALGCGIFIMAYSIFHFPMRTALMLATGVLALMVGATALSGEIESWWSLLLIASIVGISTGVTRYVAEASEVHEETERHLLVARERERVARDVHDILGHTLTVISLKAELAGKLIEADPLRAKEEVAEIHSLSREAIAEVRTTVGTLRARRLDAELGAAHDALVDAGISPTISGDVTPVDPRFQVLFAWVVREAVTNVVRHSGASTCVIEVKPRSVTVVDNGRGFRNSPEGNGLRGMKERVAEAGGTVTILGLDAGGTQMTVTL